MQQTHNIEKLCCKHSANGKAYRSLGCKVLLKFFLCDPRRQPCNIQIVTGIVNFTWRAPAKQDSKFMQIINKRNRKEYAFRKKATGAGSSTLTSTLTWRRTYCIACSESENGNTWNNESINISSQMPEQSDSRKVRFSRPTTHLDLLEYDIWHKTKDIT